MPPGCPAPSRLAGKLLPSLPRPAYRRLSTKNTEHIKYTLRPYRQERKAEEVSRGKALGPRPRARGLQAVGVQGLEDQRAACGNDILGPTSDRGCHADSPPRDKFKTSGGPSLSPFHNILRNSRVGRGGLCKGICRCPCPSFFRYKSPGCSGQQPSPTSYSLGGSVNQSAQLSPPANQTHLPGI